MFYFYPNLVTCLFASVFAESHKFVEQGPWTAEYLELSSMMFRGGQANLTKPGESSYFLFIQAEPTLVLSEMDQTYS